MKKRVNLLTLLMLLAFADLTLIWCWSGVPAALKTAVTVISALYWLKTVLLGIPAEDADKRLRTLKKGISTVYAGGITAAAASATLLCWCIFADCHMVLKFTGVGTALIAVGALIFSGMMRILIAGRQIKPGRYLLLLMLWWCPVVNIFLVRSFYKNAVREYIFEADRAELDASRAEDGVCRTKYPVLLVHGIFFRDWQLVNYWGRIPAALEKNGARIFYGEQQSALSIAESAAEVKAAIERVIAETGAEKVNIIAHSKGGLDSRYAVSCLGMDRYVATLTTINTPHKGCDMVDYLLKKLPGFMVRHIERRYNGIFHSLGDRAPDFMAGVTDLSAERAAGYDELMPDSPLVSYRSVMSAMSRAGSAGFPLNMGYLLIKKLNGANDGLVWEESAKHGSSYKLITVPGKRGISHGDVIDLMRENIDGFDVREFYVELLSELREEGF